MQAHPNANAPITTASAATSPASLPGTSAAAVPATSTLRGTPGVTTPARRGGLLYHYGPQAWIDMVMSHVMLVKKALPIINHTFLPILRLVGDKAQIDADYAAIKARRETVGWFDSPRERWRKHYGNFVREAEWSLLELRKHFDQTQYEEIVIGTSVALAKEDSAWFIDMMNGMSDMKPSEPAATAATGETKPKGIQKLLFDMFNPAGFLTGPAEITEFNPAEGSMTMYVPECAWHVCAAQESLPNPDALPELGCLAICKGAFEKLFNEGGGALSMDFEPHLPETACTVRMRWPVS